MDVVVDRDRCVASGACALAAPRVFAQDEDGIVEVRLARVPEGEQEAAREAADACPAAVIELS